MIDPPPYSQPITEMMTSKLGSLTSRWTLWINSIFNVLFNTQLYGITQIQSPAGSGFSYQIPSTVGVFVLTPAAAYAVGAVTLPVTPFDRQQISVTSSKTVTAFTVSVAAGQTILNSPTTLVAGLGFSYIFIKSISTWCRLS